MVIPIENIVIGDKVITHDGREVDVIDIFSQSVTHSKLTQCLMIKKGFYGPDNKYEVIEDLYISWGHLILIEDIFHAAKYNPIFKYESITNKSYYTYYGIRTPDHLTDTIVANGIPVETWGGWLHHNKFDLSFKKEYRLDGNRRKLKKI